MSRVLILFSAACLSIAVPARAQVAEPFKDVPPWHWAYEAVEVVRTRGLMIGYPPDWPEPTGRISAASSRTAAEAPWLRRPR